MHILCSKYVILPIENSQIYLQKIEEFPCLIYDPVLLAVARDMDRSVIPLVACTEFVYDTSIFQRTMTSDWDLVCNRHWLIHVGT